MFATKFKYKENESALGFGLPESGIICPSFVLIGNANPLPNVFSKIKLSAVKILH